ncbi:hypothetical protein GCM10022381_14360 [Leifsonia kafniensis]|uniref:TIGR02611 family protein n=1 Tax=Leifsonia kafniensis TaxID=475957 RepID=A0ABP7KCA7_9MICO
MQSPQRWSSGSESGEPPVDGQPVDGLPVDGQPVDGQPVTDPPRKGPAARAFTNVRAGIGRHPTANRVYRTTVGVTGAGTVVLGVLLIPLPGPGSLIALGGLALLGTEFSGAKKVSTTMNKAAKAAVKRAKEHRAAKAESARAAESTDGSPARYPSSTGTAA